MTHPDLTETGELTREWYLRITPMQKTSGEMTEGERDGADWQDGYDTMVHAARVQQEEICRLRFALEDAQNRLRGAGMFGDREPPIELPCGVGHI